MNEFEHLSREELISRSNMIETALRKVYRELGDCLSNIQGVKESRGAAVALDFVQREMADACVTAREAIGKVNVA